jgi:hypothetical protein
MSDEFDDYDLEPEDSRGVSRETGREKKKVRGRPFGAGQSGNPAGKPKVTGIEDVRAIAREWTQLAIETLVEVMSNPDEKGAARVSAAGVILDRGWGKAPQTVVVDGEVDVARLDNTSLDEATRRELASYVGNALAGAIEAENTGKLH